LNETFCHALLQAGLNEEDVAARLGVDTKTVRRWIEGRALPYRRHRWALAALLSTAETDLWPQLRSAQPRPEELLAIYPHLGTVPREVLLRLFGSAQREISFLDHLERPLAADRDVVRALAQKVTTELRVRICLAEPGDAEVSTRPDTSTPAADRHNALELYAPLHQSSNVEIRVHRKATYSFIYCADDQLLVAQRAYAIPAERAPVLHLQRTTDGNMFDAYLESFERTWADAHLLR
jgi:transcriptional regulator with XRE-family HTH domain